MIPRRTITLYPGMWRDAVEFLFSGQGAGSLKLFEREFARFLGVEEAVATASGTDALTSSTTYQKVEPSPGVEVSPISPSMRSMNL